MFAHPGESGFELMRWTRRLDAPAGRVAAIAITAYAGGNHERRAMEAGFDMFRSKPITPEEVSAALLELIDHRRVGRRLRRRAVP